MYETKLINNVLFEKTEINLFDFKVLLLAGKWQPRQRHCTDKFYVIDVTVQDSEVLVIKWIRLDKILVGSCTMRIKHGAHCNPGTPYAQQINGVRVVFES